MPHAKFSFISFSVMVNWQWDFDFSESNTIIERFKNDQRLASLLHILYSIYIFIMCYIFISTHSLRIYMYISMCVCVMYVYTYICMVSGLRSKLNDWMWMASYISMVLVYLYILIYLHDFRAEYAEWLNICPPCWHTSLLQSFSYSTNCIICIRSSFHISMLNYHKIYRGQRS